MINNILHEIQKEIEASNELNEIIKEFKDVVENFIHNLEYFEEMYKIGDCSAKTVAFLKNFASHIKAVNTEYKSLIDAQEISRQTEKNYFAQLSQKNKENIDKHFSQLEKSIQKKIDLEFKNIHHSMLKFTNTISSQIGNINTSLESLKLENEQIKNLLDRVFSPEISWEGFEPPPAPETSGWNELADDDGLPF